MNNKLNIYVPPQNNIFNFVRMVCCFVVMYEHINIVAELAYFSLNIRSIAVGVFFVYSGFWVCRSFIQSDNLKTYCKKRVSKIVPVYFFVLLLQFFIGCLYVKDITGYIFSLDTLKYFVCNIIFMNFLCPSLPDEMFSDVAINGSLWTIKIEVGFYILLPVIIWTINRMKKFQKHLFLLLYTVSVLVNIVIRYVVTYYNLSTSLYDQLPQYIPYFLTGMFFCIAPDYINRFKKVFLPASIIVLLIYIFSAPGTTFRVLLMQTVLPLAVGGGSIGIGDCCSKNKIIKFIATNDISFELYLIHWPILVFLLKLSKGCSGFYVMFLTIFISIIVGIIIKWVFGLKKIIKH